MTTNDEDAIRQVVTDWIAATKAGDTETVLSLMAEDVVFLLPGRPPMVGREAFRAASAGMKPSEVEFDGTSTIREVRVCGDWAYVWSELTVVVRPKNGGGVKRAGPVLSIFKKENDRWVIYRDANMLTVVE